MNVKELLHVIDQHIPLSTSESWDNVGLLIGSEQSKVEGVMTTLDCTLEVVDEALAHNMNTIVAHHPLIFKGVKNITDEGYGQIIKKIIKNDMNLIALHTNLDAYEKGVSYMIGQKIGLKNMTILNPNRESYFKMQIFVPDQEVEMMKSVFNEHHLAETDEYSNVFFQTQGKGQFKPSENANPAIGQRNKTEIVHETKLEFMISSKEKALATKLVNEYHPYEEPVYDFIEMKRESKSGLGIIGELDESLSIHSFVKLYKEQLHIPAVRYIGKQNINIERIAIVGGAAVEYADVAKSKNADLFITGDVKHHEALDAIMDDINILDANHYSEYVMKEGLKDLLEEWTEHRITVQSSEVNTDPYQYM